MFKHKAGRISLGLIAAAGIVLGSASASQAAVQTWYSGNATEWSTYSESSSSYNTYSRTGQYFEVLGVSGGLTNLVNTKVWFGTTYTSSWQPTQSIGGTRKTGVSGQGKFQFHWGGAVTYGSYGVVARATDVKLAGASRQAAPNIEGLSADDLFALETPANDYQVAVSDFRLLADDDGTRLLAAEGDGWTVFTVLTSDSIAFSTKSTDAEQSQRAAALHVVNPDAGVDEQYVFTDEKHREDAAAFGGLVEIGEGVFVDEELDSRAGYDPTKSRSASEYVIALSSGAER